MTEEDIRRIVREEIERAERFRWPSQPTMPVYMGRPMPHCPGCKPGIPCGNVACPLLPRIT